MTQDIFHLILRAQADYARCIDDDRLENWPDYFDDPCTYKITTAANYREGLEAGIVFANSQGMLVDRVSALREANIYERHTYRHILGVPSILRKSTGPCAAKRRFWSPASCETPKRTSSRRAVMWTYTESGNEA